MEKCNICTHELPYHLNPQLTPEEIKTFREDLKCHNCRSTSRDRIMMWGFSNCMSSTGLLDDLTINKGIRILESSGYRGHPSILDSKFDYYNTKYELKSTGKNLDPRKFADFQKLHYENNFFDYILASDVFEHIRLDDDAFSEIYRTLKFGGYFIMTVPFAYNRKETLVKVRPEGEKDLFLTPPEYHAENTLVYRIYGKDIFDKLKSFGFFVCYLRIQEQQYCISKQEIFLCRKGQIPDTKFLITNSNLVIYKKEEYYDLH